MLKYKSQLSAWVSYQTVLGDHGVPGIKLRAFTHWYVCKPYKLDHSELIVILFVEQGKANRTVAKALVFHMPDSGFYPYPDTFLE